MMFFGPSSYFSFVEGSTHSLPSRSHFIRIGQTGPGHLDGSKHHRARFYAATFLVGVFFAYIYSLKRQQYILYWIAAWVSLRFIIFAQASRHGSVQAHFSLRSIIFSLRLLASAFFLGAQLYTRVKALENSRGLGIAVFFALWAAANAFQLFSFSLIVPASLVYVAVGYLFWRESQRFETLADRLLGVAFTAWGFSLSALHFLKFTPESLGQGIRPVTAIPTVFVSMLLVMAIYEEEKRRVERNMLALSNLNLATSSFVGGEIQRMLAQALDRVLGRCSSACRRTFPSSRRSHRPHFGGLRGHSR